VWFGKTVSYSELEFIGNEIDLVKSPYAPESKCLLHRQNWHLCSRLRFPGKHERRFKREIPSLFFLGSSRL